MKVLDRTVLVRSGVVLLVGALTFAAISPLEVELQRLRGPTDFGLGGVASLCAWFAIGRYLRGSGWISAACAAVVGLITGLVGAEVAVLLVPNPACFGGPLGDTCGVVGSRHAALPWAIVGGFAAAAFTARQGGMLVAAVLAALVGSCAVGYALNTTLFGR